MSKRDERGADFLPPRILDWAENAESRALLGAVASEYLKVGAWPSLPALQRRFVQEGRNVDLVTAATSMPHEVGFRDFYPDDQVGLLLLGLYLSEQADPLLARFVAFVELAARRYAEAGDTPPTVARQDLAAELALSEHEAAALSRVILREAPFLGGGGADPDRWSRDVTEQIVPFLNVRDIDDYLRIRAEQLRLNRVAASAGEEGRGFTAVPRGLQVAGGALAAVAAAYTSIKGLPSSVIGIAVAFAVGALVWATIGFRQRTRGVRALVVVIPLLAGVAAGGVADALRESPVSTDDQRREKTVRAAKRILLRELRVAQVTFEGARKNSDPAAILPLSVDAWEAYGPFMAEELPDSSWQPIADYYSLAEKTNENPEVFSANSRFLLDTLANTAAAAEAELEQAGD